LATYRYIGPYERTYPDIVVGGHVLVVEPGELADFEEAPPGDCWWVPADPPKKTPAKGRDVKD
jgi:hypothetical protein